FPVVCPRDERRDQAAEYLHHRLRLPGQSGAQVGPAECLALQMERPRSQDGSWRCRRRVGRDRARRAAAHLALMRSVSMPDASSRKTDSRPADLKPPRSYYRTLRFQAAVRRHQAAPVSRSPFVGGWQRSLGRTTARLAGQLRLRHTFAPVSAVSRVTEKAPSARPSRRWSLPRGPERPHRTETDALRTALPATQPALSSPGRQPMTEEWSDAPETPSRAADRGNESPLLTAQTARGDWLAPAITLTPLVTGSVTEGERIAQDLPLSRPPV